MTLRISDTARNAAAGAVAALVDGGAGAGKIRVYTGAQPAGGPGAAATGTLLAEFALSDPAFTAPAAGGTIALDTTPAVATTGITAGTAGWFRVLDSNNAAIIDGSVTATGGGGDIELDTTTVSTGVTITLTAVALTMPAA